jgi:hypothetical protein
LVAQRRWNSRSLSSGVLGSCVLLGFSPFLVGLKSAFSLQISLGSPASGDEAFSRQWQSNAGFGPDSGPYQGSRFTPLFRPER